MTNGSRRITAATPLGDPDGAGELVAEGAIGGGDEAAGAAEAGGDADGSIEGGATDGDGLAIGDGDGDGLGVGAAGPGPTNTSAARIPPATRTPETSPATIVTAVFMRREGTSTDGRDDPGGGRGYDRRPVTTRALRERLLPAILTAAGVTLVSAGVLSYTMSGSVAAADEANEEAAASAEPTIVTDPPALELVLPSLPPVDGSASPSPAPSATPNAARVATRVVVERLGIDLAVVKPRGSSATYPQCNVALYIQELSQPGNGRATYLYAHARDGMFGPIYERAIQKQHGGPKSMIGMIVQVYTSDDLVFTYEVTEVRLHQLNLDAAIQATTEELWLQTSEGPKGTPGKTQLVARLLISQPVDHAAAHPKARPVTCA